MQRSDVDEVARGVIWRKKMLASSAWRYTGCQRIESSSNTSLIEFEFDKVLKARDRARDWRILVSHARIRFVRNSWGSSSCSKLLELWSSSNLSGWARVRNCSNCGWARTWVVEFELEPLKLCSFKACWTKQSTILKQNLSFIQPFIWTKSLWQWHFLTNFAGEMTS